MANWKRNIAGYYERTIDGQCVTVIHQGHRTGDWRRSRTFWDICVDGVLRNQAPTFREAKDCAYDVIAGIAMKRIAKTDADRTYRGRTIRACVCTDRPARWIVQTHHFGTGNPDAEDQCPHFRTLAEARDWIDESTF
jgi:hypothetical protein